MKTKVAIMLGLIRVIRNKRAAKKFRRNEIDGEIKFNPGSAGQTVTDNCKQVCVAKKFVIVLLVSLLVVHILVDL